MVQYEAALIDLEPAPRQAVDKIISHDSEELTTINADPVYATVPCVAAEQTPLTASFLIVAVRSLAGVPLDIYIGPIVHHPTEYLRSWGGVKLLTLYGLPASEFGYIRAVTVKRLGEPVPFMMTVLDADLPTGLITDVAGESSTVLQKLKYVVRGRRSDQEFESDEIDLTAAIPPEVEVTVRRKTSAKLNRKRMR